MPVMWARGKKMKIGDLVRLKSGGPVMTVSYVGTTNIKCTWFKGEDCHKENFPIDTLIKLF